MPKLKTKRRTKPTTTTTSQIKSALRLLTLRCRERSAALKAANRTCHDCNAKASTAKGREVKVAAHHLKQPNWDRVLTAIREELLPPPSSWRCLCESCHDRAHANDKHRFVTSKPQGLDAEQETNRRHAVRKPPRTALKAEVAT